MLHNLLYPFLLIYPVSFIAIIWLPPMKSEFYFIVLSSLVLTLSAVFIILDKRIARYSAIRYRDCIFAIFFFCILSTLSFFRWEIFPMGMIDSPALWAGKAAIISDRYLDPMIDLDIFNIDWKFPNYPLAMPLSIASFSIVMKQYSQDAVYLYSIMVVFLLVYTLFTIATSIHSKIRNLCFWIFSATIVFLSGYLSVQSDLCADFSVSVFLMISTYLIFSDNKFSFILIALSISNLAGVKNEGLVLSVILIFIWLFKFLNENGKNNFSIICKFLVIFIIFNIPNIFFKINQDLIPQDFQDSGDVTQNKNFLESTILISKYLIKFYFKENIIFLASMLFFFVPRSKNLYVFLVATSAIFFFSIIYLFSSYGLESHLNTSYFRVHYQFSLLYILMFFLDSNKNRYFNV